MMIETLKIFILRDFGNLKTEIENYADEHKMWQIGGDITNSAGNLCLHLIGNLNHFIGTHLGQTDYVRERDLEFSSKNTNRADLLSMIDETSVVIETSMDTIADERLSDEYPLEFFGNKVTVGWVLMHLATHLNYHLGQINYHRRIFDVAKSDAE